ncbi:succinylglutamate desuccinylase [Marinomonas ushuaiensis DSM 15871]|uniref:Succinylglutamate desuccinylase n=1 Tax=Marinomonas ushuaiensis DSM 15871 TaxID=1122207 RepID=X7E4D8_9GAMM|nr:DUF1826 domain-containing protein [Marinomonas ushuaiensis]ETX10031.1 succinylglutamate desuccinylase [Marinomonas ushuaiensis DSM 15871]
MKTENKLNQTPSYSSCVLPLSSREDTYPDVLADIYQDETNIAIWKRSLSAELLSSVDRFIKTNTMNQTTLAVTAENTHEVLVKAFGETKISKVFSDDIAQLVDMFCCLFDLKRAGLRLTIMDNAMCPKFHVDKIPCRLVSTYQGIATEWIPNHLVDRSKLGRGSLGKKDEESGLLKNWGDVHSLNCGDVALIKGERWEGNEGGGLVHRSPPVPVDMNRLLLTLDFIDFE